MIACQKDQRESELAILSTNEVLISGTTENGVVLSASIVLESSDPIIERGFVYGIASIPTLDESAVLKIQELASNAFSMPIEEGLIPDTTYYVRSFVRTKAYLIYGNEVSFYSNGSEAPVVNTIEPALAFFGDTIKIIGKNIDNTGQRNHIWFGEFEATQVWGKKDTIYAIVPKGLNRKWSEVEIQLYGRNSSNTKTFELHSPIISSISDKEGQYPDTITINGRGFAELNRYIKFGSHLIAPYSVTEQNIEFVVPFLGKGETATLDLVQFDEVLTLEPAFKYNEQVIYGVEEDSIYYGEPIVIKANNFDFRRCKVNITVEGSRIYSYCNYYQDSLSFNILYGSDYQFQKENNYKLEFKEDVLFSGDFIFNQPYIEVEQSELSFSGDLSLNIRGVSYYRSVDCYYTGSKDTVVSGWVISDGSGLYKLALPPQLIPGKYQVFLKYYVLGSSNVVDFQIMEPELYEVQPTVFDRTEDFIQISANYLPYQRYSWMNYIKVRHHEDHAETNITVDADNRFVPNNLIGKGPYDLIIEYGESRTELLNCFTFDDCFSFFKKAEGIQKLGHNIGIKLNDKIVIFEACQTYIIDINTGSYEWKDERNTIPYYKPYVVSHGESIYRINPYGQINYLDEAELNWIPIEITNALAGVDVLVSVEDELWSIDVLGNIYVKTGEIFVFSRKFPGYPSNVDNCMYYDHKSFLFGTSSVKIYERDSFQMIDEVSYDLFTCHKHNTTFFCLGDKAMIFNDFTRKFYLFDFTSKSFSHDEINVFPQGYSSVIYGNKKELFLVNSGAFYKYDK